MKQKSEVRHSERFKRKVLARWRVLSTQGARLEEAALEMGIPAGTLAAWAGRSEQPLLVPVQIAEERADDEPSARKRSANPVVTRAGIGAT